MPTSPSRRLALITGASLALLAGCGNSSSDSGSDSSTAQGAASSSKVKVVASTNVYGDITEQIGGDKVDVTSILSDPDQDPHSFEANTQNQLALSKAEVVIENGGGYDDFVDRMLKSSNNSSAELINAVKVSGKAAPEGGELNEHVWYDFPTVSKIADRIAAALGKAHPRTPPPSPRTPRPSRTSSPRWRRRKRTSRRRTAARASASPNPYRCT